MKSKLTLLILSFCMFGLTSMATTPLPEQKQETTFEASTAPEFVNVEFNVTEFKSFEAVLVQIQLVENTSAVSERLTELPYRFDRIGYAEKLSNNSNLHFRDKFNTIRYLSRDKS